MQTTLASSILLFLSLLSFQSIPTAAAPTALVPDNHFPPSHCLTAYDAQVVANNFGQLLSNYSNATANAVLSPDYTDQSDSANTLINGGKTTPLTLGQLTFSTRAAFEAAQGTQANIPFTALNVWHTCDVVIVRWVSTLTPQQVQGIDVLLVERAQLDHDCDGKNQTQPWLIKTTYGEFNSGAWLIDGGSPECSS